MSTLDTIRIVDRRALYGAKSSYERFLDPLLWQNRFDAGRKIIRKMRRLKLMASIHRAKRILLSTRSNVVSLTLRKKFL